MILDQGGLGEEGVVANEVERKLWREGKIEKISRGVVKSGQIRLGL